MKIKTKHSTNQAIEDVKHLAPVALWVASTDTSAATTKVNIDQPNTLTARSQSSCRQNTFEHSSSSKYLASCWDDEMLSGQDFISTTQQQKEKASYKTKPTTHHTPSETNAAPPELQPQSGNVYGESSDPVPSKAHLN